MMKTRGRSALPLRAKSHAKRIAELSHETTLLVTKKKKIREKNRNLENKSELQRT